MEGDFVFGAVLAAILWDIYSVRQSAADARAYAIWTMLLLSAVVLVASPPRSH
ncbi:MAG TPA: hypothetical protein VK355_07260 [Candidatus Binatia bacterium]|nr:hypothetical protein [Candidatus Binatia bacterium]